MTTSVYNIITGPAQVYYAPSGTALPSGDTVAYGVAWGGAWVPFGYTKTPLACNYAYEKFDAMVQEGLGAVKRIKTSETLTLEVTLAELTAANLALGTEGTTTYTPAGAGVTLKEEVEFGGKFILTDYAWGFEGPYTAASGITYPIRFFLYRGTVSLNGALEFSKTDYPGVPMRIEAMEDLTKTIGKRLVKMQRVLGPAT